MQLGRAITKPLSSKLSTDGIIRYILTLPLNFIPVVGTVFFLGEWTEQYWLDICSSVFLS